MTESEQQPEQPRIAVSCPMCKRLFNTPSGSRPGTVLRCPFCSQQMRLTERVVLVAEAVEGRMTLHRRQLGARGEVLAETYLRGQGFKILHRNLRLGRIGEIDLVGEERGVLVFIEVKTKLQGEEIGGFVNITVAKQRKLRQLGEAYLQRYPVPPGGARFDAVEIDFTAEPGAAPAVRHMRNAFR